MGNEKCNIVKLQPQYTPGRNFSFGGDKEKEMIESFNTFDILWYAPENSEKLEEWIAFTNVSVLKVTTEELFKSTALLGQMLKLIVITTGSYAEKTIPKLAGLLKISVIIYCMNLDYRKKWSEKYDIICGVYSTPEGIFENLLGLQKLFGFPLFSYKIISYEEFSFNYYDSFKKNELLLKDSNFTLKLNKYERFCSSCLYEFKLASLNHGDFLDYFGSETLEIIKFFYGGPIFSIPGMDYFLSDINDKPKKQLLHFFYGLTLTSAYFSKLPYLYGLLKYEEIVSLLKEELTIKDLREDYKEIQEKHLDIILTKLVKEKSSILEEINLLKFLQSFLIKFVKFWAKIFVEFEYDDYCKFPLLIKYLMDIDFCLKIFFCDIYKLFKSKQYQRKCSSSLNEVDKRIMTFQVYCASKHYKEAALKYVSEENLNILNDTLSIKDFIVIGDSGFHKKIKAIENKIKDGNFEYIDIIDLRDYLKFLKQKKSVRYRNFAFFVIIKDKDAENAFKELYSLKNEFALILYLIIFNKDTKKLINKRPFQIQSHLPLFIANNENEIINLINSQEFANCGFNFENQALNIYNELEKVLKENNIKIPKIDFKEETNVESLVERLSSEDGWELVDKVPEQIFKDAILGLNGNTILTSNIKMNIFEMYNEKKIDFLFYETYCKYFNFFLLPELMWTSFNIPIKHFLYAYTLHEDSNSFYYLLNKDLRSGDYLKVKKFIEIISMINYSFRENIIKSYEGQLFRGTSMEDQYIEEKIKVGNILTNLSFWSASKERKIAEAFLTGKNILFIIETKKNNIDIDYEQISKVENEKEVLFLPYSKFLVKSIKKIKFKGKEVFEVNLEGLDENHERDNIKAIPLLNEMTSELIN